MSTIFIATSNPGKLRDFAAAAARFAVEVGTLPGMASLPAPPENAPTFEANACAKAEYYSRTAKDCFVLADDSGLEVAALYGAPGVRSARYAEEAGPLLTLREMPPEAGPSCGAGTGGGQGRARSVPAVDAANNARLLEAMRDIPEPERGARFVCVIAAARNGRLQACFRGEVGGTILHAPRGVGGFGYDPLFYVPVEGRTMAELSPERKAELSHRGQAFRKFLAWFVSLDR
jgi:XTP/dITP diphosphohydrolase